jgi:hypothetical protein
MFQSNYFQGLLPDTLSYLGQPASLLVLIAGDKSQLPLLNVKVIAGNINNIPLFCT